MSELRVDEARVLAEVFGKAVDHHDASKPEVTYNLAALANQAAPAATPNFLEGLLANPLVAAAIQAALVGLIAKLTAPKPAPAPTPPVVLPPTAPAPPVVTAPVAGVVVPDAVKLELSSVSGPHRSGAPTLAYKLDGSAIVLIGDTTSLDDGSVLNFDAGLKAGSVELRVDLDPAKTPPGQVNHPALLGKIKYIAEDVATGEVLGSIGGEDASIRSPKDYTDAKVDKGVAFVPNRWAESGGMSVAVKPKRRGGPVRIYATIGEAESVGFVTPEIR